MKLFVLFTSIFFSVNFAQSQALSASLAIEQECFCRVQGFQSGNGVISCTATGGSGNYQFNWTGPTPTSVTSNSVPTVVVREPGFYFIEVVDVMSSTTLYDSIYMDSVNPIADFTVVSNDLIDLGNSQYKGYNSADVIFENNSLNFTQPSNPNSDTIFQWTFDNSATASWFLTFDMNSTNNTYGVGIYEAALVAKNMNDCRDTAFATITIYATSADIESVDNDEFMVIPNFSSKYIDIVQGSEASVSVKIFNIQGQLVSEDELTDSQNLIPFDHPTGIYVYQIVKNSEIIFSNKFQF